MNKVSVENSEHYTWGDGCDGWHLVKQPEVSVIREHMPPGTAEVRHRHHHARQFFFVLAGELVIDRDEQARSMLRTGDGLEIPPRVFHQVLNRSQAPVDFLVVSQPPSHGDRETSP